MYDFARRSVSDKAEILFISCMGLRTVGVIRALEEDLGIPVVTSNQASFWQALRLAGVKAHIEGFGARHGTCKTV
jgi:maleate cis-trans isomerase